MQDNKQQVEFYTEQLTGSKLRKQYEKAIQYHSVYLTYMQTTSCEMLQWIYLSQAGVKTARRNINNLRYSDNIPLMAKSEEELKSLLRRVKKLA